MVLTSQQKQELLERYRYAHTPAHSFFTSSFSFLPSLCLSVSILVIHSHSLCFIHFLDILGCSSAFHGPSGSSSVCSSYCITLCTVSLTSFPLPNSSILSFQPSQLRSFIYSILSPPPPSFLSCLLTLSYWSHFYPLSLSVSPSLSYLSPPISLISSFPIYQIEAFSAASYPANRSHRTVLWAEAPPSGEDRQAIRDCWAIHYIQTVYQ